MKKMYAIVKESSEVKVSYRTKLSEEEDTKDVLTRYGHGITTFGDWRNPEDIESFDNEKDALEYLNKLKSKVRSYGNGLALVIEYYLEERWMELDEFGEEYFEYSSIFAFSPFEYE